MESNITNRQLVLENIDRIDRLVYTPLERRYLRVRFVGTVLTYIGLMVLPFLIFLADDFKGQDMLVICAESLLAIAAFVNLLLLPKACA